MAALSSAGMSRKVVGRGSSSGADAMAGQGDLGDAEAGGSGASAAVVLAAAAAAAGAAPAVLHIPDGGVGLGARARGVWGAVRGWC